MTNTVNSGTTALLTDHYELTMLQAALRSGAASRRAVFEVFARHLPHGRRYGVVAGTGRLLDALERFRFGPDELSFLRENQIVDPATLQYLSSYRFSGNIWGYAEGDVYFPGSPILVVEGTFAESVLLETVALSILNHDCAVASAASRMVTAAGGPGPTGRPLIEMGSRRTHEGAAVAAARAAYIAGFASTSNLEARFAYGVPSSGTSAHAFTLVHDSEREAFAAQLSSLGSGTTLLVDTYSVEQAVRAAVAEAGPSLGAVRIDSGDLPALAVSVRALLDSLGATGTRIILTGDLDEYSIAGLAVAPVDGYGVGTSLVTGSGAPTAALVYKLVARSDTPMPDGEPAGTACARSPSGPSASRGAAGASGPSAKGTRPATRRPSGSGCRRRRPRPGRPGTAAGAGAARARWSGASRWRPRAPGTPPSSPSCPATPSSSPRGYPAIPTVFGPDPQDT